MIRNDIEASSTGNCTQFADALCEFNGLLNFSTKRNQHRELATDITQNSCVTSCEPMLIESASELLDNMLYYISGIIVKSTLKTPKCADCRSQLLLDDANGFKAVSYLFHAKFSGFKQNGGLLFPSVAVLKIVKATKVIEAGHPKLLQSETKTHMGKGLVRWLFTRISYLKT